MSDDVTAADLLGEKPIPATEAGQALLGSLSFLPNEPYEVARKFILAIESESRRSTVVGPECYPQAHRYKAVPGSRDLVRCYRCGKERYA